MKRIKALKRINDEIQKLGFKYYIHCGFGVFLQTGFHDLSNLEDVDIRVMVDSVDEKMFAHFDKLSDTSLVKVRGPVHLHGSFLDNDCLIIEANGIHFDIVGKMVTVPPDLKPIEFPLKDSWFDQVDYVNYSNMTLPVLKPEPLVLYYLVHRRGENTGKSDFTNIKLLCSSKNFSEERFKKMLKEHFEPEKEAEFLRLYNQYK